MKEKTKNKVVNNWAIFHFDYTSNKVALTYFLEWCRNTIPKRAKDITIELVEDFDEEDGEYIGTYLKLSWKEKLGKRKMKNVKY